MANSADNLSANRKIHELQSVIDNLPGSIYWKNMNGVYLGRNKYAHEKMLTCDLEQKTSEDSVIGKTDYDLFEKDVADRYRKHDLEVMNTRKELSMVEPITLSSGEVIFQLSQKRPLYDDKMKVIGVIGNTVDITQIKRLEEQVSQLKENEVKLKTISAMGAMIAHELRTPISAIGMAVVNIEKFLPILIEGYEKSINLGNENKLRNDQLNYLKNIITDMKQSIDYSDTTISSMLSFIKDDDSPERVEIFSLKEQVQHVVDTYPYKNVSHKNLLHIKHIDAVNIKSNKRIVSHVIQNLIKNALHAINEAQKGSISIWSEIKGNYITLFFEDTATGIEKDKLPNIFDAFYTTKKKSSESIGIGLYFCKRSLQKMQADISCESEFGKYTKFSITVPLSE